MRTHRIVVADILNKTTDLTTEDGSIIFNLLMNNIESGEKSILDFSKFTVIPTFFANYAIGQLYSRFDSETLQNLIAIDSSTLNTSTRRPINMSIDIAKTQFTSQTLDEDEK